MQDPVFLELKDVSVSFAGRSLLDKVSLSLPYSQWMLFLGANGSGKTTLLRLISGRLYNWQGELWVDGLCYTQHNWNAYKAYQHGIAVVEQLPLFPEDIFAWEYLLWGLSYQGNPLFLKRDVAICQLKDKLFFTKNFKFNLHSRIRDLSLSDRFKLCVASALLRARNLVLWDESTIFLGHEEKSFLPEMIQGLTKRGLSTLIVTHEDLSWAKEVKSIYYLENKKVKILTPEELEIRMTYPLRPNLSPVKKERELVFEAQTNCGSLRIAQGEIACLLADSEIPLREWENFLWGFDTVVKGNIFLKNEKISDKTFIQRRQLMAWIVPILGASEEPAVYSLLLPLLFKNKSPLLHKYFIKKSSSLSFGRTIVPNYLWSRLNTPWSKLSGGEKQAMILCRELAGKYSFLIASFATQGLDRSSLELFWQKLRQFAMKEKSGLLLLMTEEKEAHAFCDTVYTLEGVKIVKKERLR